ncbi:hypothetical protein IT575_15215 [bacterium]|nr:hypothetical protein [bacterium]
MHRPLSGEREPQRRTALLPGSLAAGLSSLLLLLCASCSSGLSQPPWNQPPPDTTAPRLQVSGIGQAQEISANTPVTCLATDEHGKVLRILVTIDGGTVLDESYDSAQAAAAFSLAWLPEFAGPHQLVLSAVDDSGNSNLLVLDYSIAAQ